MIRLIALELHIDEALVGSARSLRRDLGMDSIAGANILFALEEEFGLELDLEDVEHLDSVGDLERLVSRSIKSANA